MIHLIQYLMISVSVGLVSLLGINLTEHKLIGGHNFQETQEKMAPDFTLPDLEGNMVSLSDYKGSYLVIHIATTWCPFCNAEAPHLEQLYQDYKDRNVNVLVIDVQEPKELVKARLKDRFNWSFPVLMDSDGTVSTAYCPPDVLPDLDRAEVMIASNLLIGPDGKILFMSLLDSKNFDAKLLALKSKLDEVLAQ